MHYKTVFLTSKVSLYRIKKLCIILLAPLFMHQAAYSYDGIPLQTLRDDPYLMNQITGEQEISPQEAASPVQETPSSAQSKAKDVPAAQEIKQTSNPEDKDTFYNAQNWYYNTNKSSQAEQEVPAQEEITEASEETPAAVQAPEPQEDAPTEQEQRSTRSEQSQNITYVAPQKFYNDAQELRLTFNYTPLYALPITEGGVRTAMHLENSFNLVPFGLGARIEYLAAELPIGLLGFGAALSYNYMQDRREDIEATVTAHFFSISFFFDFKYTISAAMAVYAHAGGGLLLVPQPQYQYDDGYIPPSENWGYPELVIGGIFQYKLTKVVSLEAGLDFMCTIGLHVPFPVLQGSFGVGWRLL